MRRIRTVKPELYRHEGLFEAERLTKLPLRVAFSGLFTVADREGRFRWRPRVLKLDVLPFDDLDFEDVLNALVEHGFIRKYQAGGESLAYIPTFLSHQVVNQREAQSSIAAPPDQEPTVQAQGNQVRAEELHRQESERTCTHVQARGEGKGKGREREKEEHLLHDALTSQRTVQTADAGANELVDQAKGIFQRIPLSDGSEYPVHVKAVADWEREFPGVDVRQEIRSTRAFWLARPIEQRKARHEIRQSLRAHLGKKQDAAGVPEEWEM